MRRPELKDFHIKRINELLRTKGEYDKIIEDLERDLRDIVAKRNGIIDHIVGVLSELEYDIGGNNE